VNVFGDKIYVIRPGILRILRRGDRFVDEHGVARNYHEQTRKEFNGVMAEVRVAVEHIFGLSKQLWKSLSRKRRILLTDVAKEYRVAMFLTNCRTCSIGNNSITSLFRSNPPSLHEYLDYLNRL